MTIRRAAHLVALGSVALSLAGCGEVPAALDDAGAASAKIADLFWLFTAVCALVWGLVAIGLAASVIGRRQVLGPLEQDIRRDSLAVRVIAGLTGLSALILVVLTAFSYFTGRSLANLAGTKPMVVQVTGNQWWWEVRYQSDDPSRNLTSANEIHVPVGTPVRLSLTSNDVIHSFWIPEIAGKRDLIPGQTNQLDLIASKPGIYRGQCAEFCGFQHAHMRLVLVAQERKDFDAWFDHELAPALEPQGPEATKGRDTFLTRACVMCHAIRGTPAGGKVAPDLTHFASRQGIAANTLPMTRGALGAWIADPQSVKPGAHMPRVELDPDELNGLIAYLEQLK